MLILMPFSLSFLKLQFSNLYQNPILLNTFSLVVLRITNTVGRLTILFLIARVIAPSEMGLIVFAISVAEMGKVISDFGVDTFAIREYAVRRSDPSLSEVRTDVAATKIFSSLIVFGFVLIFYIINYPFLQAILGIVIALTIFTGVTTNYVINYFQSELRISAIVLPLIIGNSVVTISLAVMILFWSNNLWVAITFPLVEATVSIIALYRFRTEHVALKKKISINRVFSLLQKTFPLGVTAIIIMLYTRLDILVLSRYVTSTEVGHYGLAFRLTEPFQLISASFAVTVFSHFSSLFVKNSEQIKKQVIIYLGATLFYGLCTALILVTVAGYGIRHWLQEYVHSIPILQVLAVALIFRVLNSTLTAVIQASGRFRLITLLSIWNLFIIGTLFLLFVPQFNAIGAAMAILLAEAINTVIQIFLVFHSFRSIKNAMA